MARCKAPTRLSTAINMPDFSFTWVTGAAFSELRGGRRPGGLWRSSLVRPSAAPRTSIRCTAQFRDIFCTLRNIEFVGRSFPLRRPARSWRHRVVRAWWLVKRRLLLPFKCQLPWSTHATDRDKPSEPWPFRCCLSVIPLWRSGSQQQHRCSFHIHCTIYTGSELRL
jgi:hypothetical protein